MNTMTFRQAVHEVSAASAATNLVVFTGVGVAMTDVFVRVLGALEPQRSRLFGVAWVGLVSVIPLPPLRERPQPGARFKSRSKRSSAARRTRPHRPPR